MILSLVNWIATHIPDLGLQSWQMWGMPSYFGASSWNISDFLSEDEVEEISESRF